MNEREVFEYLYEVAQKSQDPRGIVSSCVVEDGKIVLSAASSDDGLWHAEDLLFKEAKEQGIVFSKDSVLYATLEPCSKRSKPGMVDCVTGIIEAGIGSVVFGARDPSQSVETTKRLREAGVSIRQTSDAEVIKRSADIFNESVTPEHKDVDVTLKPID